MMNFGPIKLLFTAVAALLILGPKRLPEALRSVSRTVKKLKAASHEVTEELKSTFDAGETGAARPVRHPAPRSVPPAHPDPEELRPGPRA